MSLARMPVSRSYRVTGIRSQSPVANRLMEMGVIEGATVEILRRAPLGDPLHVRLGDYELSMRATEADLIEVTAE